MYDPEGEGSCPSGEGSGRALAWSNRQPRGPAHSHTFRDVLSVGLYV